MDKEQLLARLIGRLYDASLNADSWDSTLDEIMRAVGCEVAALFVEDRTRRPASLEVVSLRGYPDMATKAYASYFADRDVRLPELIGLPVGQIYVDDRTIPFSRVECSEIYNDFYRPTGVAHGIGAVAFNDGRRFGILSAHRPIKAGGFRPDEIALFKYIVPHLKRALQLHRQVARANAVAGGLTVALDHFQMSVFLTDQTGEVIAFNLAAESLLREADCPLRLVANRLLAVSPANANSLAQAIAAAASASGGQISTVPPVLRMAKADGSGAIGVMVAPARRTERIGGPGGQLVVVFVSNPGQPVPTSPELLTRQFGLSPAEALVATQLAAGTRIEDIADRRGVSQETVRVQIKRVLAKTETRSQGQLVSLLSRSLAALRREGNQG